jgi:hypothetical protein
MNAREKEAEELSTDIELLLPWYTAGILSRRDTARVERALANDSELAHRCELVCEELGKAMRVDGSVGARSERTRLLVAALVYAALAYRRRSAEAIRLERAA